MGSDQYTLTNIVFKDDCAACSQRPQVLTFPEDVTLKSVIDFLMETPS